MEGATALVPWMRDAGWIFVVKDVIRKDVYTPYPGSLPFAPCPMLFVFLNHIPYSINLNPNYNPILFLLISELL